VLLAGPFYAAAVLLVLAGVPKVLDPTSLVRATRSARLTVPGPVVRVLAAGEVVLGVAALLTGSRWTTVGVALSYAAFTAFVVLALSRGGVLASCGCFGKADVPATRTHAVVTSAFAAAAASGAPGALPLELPLIVSTAAVAVCAYLVLAVQPLLDVR
jgi:hypothetical protein